MLDSGLNRRALLQLLASGAIFAVGGPARASETRIERLIAQSRAYEHISQRIDFISGALRGSHYRGYTLIGGPHRPEKFVVRDDGFDCVTFCETVLAAAIAHDAGEFEATLRKIRYHDGVMNWYERNHYFFEWSRHNIENKICRAVVLDGAVEIEKTVHWHRALGRRHFSMQVVPRAVLLANKDKVMNGDIVGFVTHRPNLDYFHIGFVIVAPDGELLLRHASESHRRVLDERMDRFVSFNRVSYVTLLRPEEPAASPVADKKI
jgi:hypothetical protein